MWGWELFTESCCFAWCKGQKSSTTITITGYDGLGTATYESDDEAFLNDFSDRIELTEEGENNALISFDASYADSAAETLLAMVRYGTLDQDSGLDIGDVVTVTIDEITARVIQPLTPL